MSLDTVLTPKAHLADNVSPDAPVRLRKRPHDKPAGVRPRPPPPSPLLAKPVAKRPHPSRPVAAAASDEANAASGAATGGGPGDETEVAHVFAAGAEVLGEVESSEDLAVRL